MPTDLDPKPQNVAELTARQGGLCAICGEDRPLVRDHDHVTGLIRGMLCHRCNRALGAFKDDPALLRAALSYLLQPPTALRYAETSGAGLGSGAKEPERLSLHGLREWIEQEQFALAEQQMVAIVQERGGVTHVRPEDFKDIPQQQRVRLAQYLEAHLG